MIRFLALSLFIAAQLAAQSIESIKNSPLYLWGEGSDNTLARADKEALKDLTSQISVQVESNFSNIVTEDEGGVEEYTELVLNTYSSTTLNQAQRKVEEHDGRFTVVRYIEKANISKLFENRRAKLLGYLNSGHLAVADYRIGDALKYYYWSLILLRSHPDVNTLGGEDHNGNQVLLISYLPVAIEAVLENLDITVARVSHDEEAQAKRVLLDIQYRDHPVTNLDYIYYTGDSWTSRLSGCHDGTGLVEFFGVSADALKDVKLKIEYTYESKSKIDLELREVIENARLPYFRSADFKIPIHERVEAPAKVKPEIVALTELDRSQMDYTRRVVEVIQAVDRKDFSRVMDHFTPEGKEMFVRLLQYGSAELINPAGVSLTALQLNDQLIVRSVPMRFRFPNNNREFIEDVVFSLNTDGRIDAVSFALGERAVNDIMGKSERFGTLEQKQQIVRFMEDYKTAYCLERLDFIESVFADNALILVGHSLKQGENIDGMYRGRLGNEDVEYIRLSKSEYIQRLRRIFAANEFVNIHFEETTVKKVNGKDRIYGIQIAQNYNSVSYADFGYLFLMFDLNNVEEPKIYVRSWQPEKDAEGRIMGLEDFTF